DRLERRLLASAGLSFSTSRLPAIGWSLPSGGASALAALVVLTPTATERPISSPAILRALGTANSRGSGRCHSAGELASDHLYVALVGEDPGRRGSRALLPAPRHRACAASGEPSAITDGTMLRSGCFCVCVPRAFMFMQLPCSCSFLRDAVVSVRRAVRTVHPFRKANRVPRRRTPHSRRPRQTLERRQCPPVGKAPRWRHVEGAASPMVRYHAKGKDLDAGHHYQRCRGRELADVSARADMSASLVRHRERNSRREPRCDGDLAAVSSPEAAGIVVACRV